MITEFDDYPIHQVPEPVCQPGTTDRNFYDRYWFNGYDREGTFLFEAAFGIYPNRHVMDGHFSVSMGGTQWAFHASRRAPTERRDSAIGPLSIEVVRPLRQLRVRLQANDTGLECDLKFSARTVAMQEPRSLLYEGTRKILDTTRLTQFGHWEGWFSVNGQRREVSLETSLGTRDRSWGVRPVGEMEMGAPGLLNSEPGVYWAWMPLHFDDMCTQFGTFEDHDGRATQLGACILPVYESLDDIPHGEDPGLEEMATARHSFDWHPGTRWPSHAELELVPHKGEIYRIEFEPILRFHMLGLGYTHMEWGHGFWKGEEFTGGESWVLDDIDPLVLPHVHVHHLCRARMDGKEGMGIIETLIIGRHDPSGFKEILDGAG